MTVAEVIKPLVGSTLGSHDTIHVTCWDGSEFGPPDAPAQVVFKRRKALRRLMWAPNELGFARAYVAGDIEVEGDLLETLQALDKFAGSEEGPSIVVDRDVKRQIVRAAVRLGVVGPPPKPPAEESRLHGGLHSKKRDAEAIAHHYDVGNEFYSIVLGSSMVYSCGYWPEGPSVDYDLADAQIGKCDLVARKLGREEGMRVLDVGCGWGTFVINAAKKYGVQAVGVTLSHEQAAFARERVRQEGLQDKVEIRVQDYRDVEDGPYDAIASIGMAEHVGLAMLPTYTKDLYALLRPGGRLLNHAIARRPGPRAETASKTSFIERYVFPDGELEPIGVMVAAIQEAGFEVRDVESLREHYALTLREWIKNLEGDWDRAVKLTSAGRARVWRLYMAGSALAFEDNRIGINQVLAVKPLARGRSGMPRSRHFMLADQVGSGLAPGASTRAAAGSGEEPVAGIATS
jgi:cyclopropane-fatty-acyl-phospholipid synthase